MDKNKLIKEQFEQQQTAYKQSLREKCVFKALDYFSLLMDTHSTEVSAKSVADVASYAKGMYNYIINDKV